MINRICIDDVATFKEKVDIGGSVPVVIQDDITE